MSPGFQAFMAHTLDFQHGCLTSVRGCLILMRAGDRGWYAWQTFATVIDRRRLNSSLLPSVPSTWTPTGGAEFSSATIDAWASIREGMQSADLELAALAGPRSESTLGSVLVGVGLGAVSRVGESDRPAHGGCVVLYTEQPLAVEAAVD